MPGNWRIVVEKREKRGGEKNIGGELDHLEKSAGPQYKRLQAAHDPGKRDKVNYAANPKN